MPLGSTYFAPQAGILIWNIVVIQNYLVTCEEVSDSQCTAKAAKDVHTHYQDVAGTFTPYRLLFGEDNRQQRLVSIAAHIHRN